MRSQNRRCALAVAIAALWTAAEARGERNDALWQLPENERFYLLKLAGGMDDGEDNRLGEHFQSPAVGYLDWIICRRYVLPERGIDDPEGKKECLEVFPALVLKRIHNYGYKNVKLADVAAVETFAFYVEMRKRGRHITQEERNEFLQGYVDFKKRLGVYTMRDRALENSLKPKKYIIKRKSR